MVELQANFGAVFQADSVDYTKLLLGPRPVKATDMAVRRGTIVNMGTARVFIGWQRDSIDELNTLPEVDKAYIDPVGTAGSVAALRVPQACSFFVCRTVSGISVLQYIED
jgi:hypothetical protein